MSAHPWPDEQIDTLRRLLVDEKLSAGQAAIRMGLTRNQVMGKAHRMQIPMAAANSGFTNGAAHPKRSRPPAIRRKPGETRPGKDGALGSRLAHRQKHPTTSQPPKPRAEPPPPPFALMLPLERLTDKSCRFPIGDPGSPGFGFCGHHNFNGLPYCEHHTRLAYQPMNARQAERVGA